MPRALQTSLVGQLGPILLPHGPYGYHGAGGPIGFPAHETSPATPAKPGSVPAVVQSANSSGLSRTQPRSPLMEGLLQPGAGLGGGSGDSPSVILHTPLQ